MQYRYHNPETNEDELVDPEVWQWVALYKNGSELHQFGEMVGDCGVFHRFAEINQSEVFAFKMVREGTDQEYTVLIPEGAKIIHFYRNYRLNIGTTDEKFIRTYIFGYETKDSTGQTHKTMMTLLPSNECIVTDDIDKVVVE